VRRSVLRMICRSRPLPIGPTPLLDRTGYRSRPPRPAAPLALRMALLFVIVVVAMGTRGPDRDYRAPSASAYHRLTQAQTRPC
jgi:hypothetical protein